MPALFMGFHGGLSFNTRYALEALPFAVVLALAALDDQTPRRREWVAALALGALVFPVLALSGGSSLLGESLIRYFPLALAGALGALWLAGRRRPGRRGVRRATGFAVALSLVWGAAIHFSIDVPAALRVRSDNARKAAAVARVVEADAAIFGWGGFKDGLAPLKMDRPELVIGDVLIDLGWSLGFAIDRFLAAGRPVWLVDEGWRDRQAKKLRRYYDVRAVPTPAVGLLRVERRRPDAPDRPLRLG